MVVPSPIFAGRQARVIEKQLLRARMRSDRKAHVDSLPPATRALIFSRPPTPLAELAPEGAIVGLYHATTNEAPTGGYARWFIENGRRIALPWFANRLAPMQFREWTDPFGGDDLRDGPYGKQPDDSAALIIPHVAFVPLLAFSEAGGRLGQGAGHYDRWLAANPQAKAIGLGWDMQLLAQLPLEPHDHRLDAVVTPTRIYWSEE